MLNTSILTLIAFVPTLGALVVLLLPRRGRVIPAFALLTTLVTFVLSLHLPAHYDYSQRGFQFVVNVPWIAHPDIHYHLGIDGLSLWLILLTTFLGPIGAAGVTLFYFDQRVRKEGFDIEWMMQSAGLGAAPPAPEPQPEALAPESVEPPAPEVLVPAVPDAAPAASAEPPPPGDPV